MKKQLTYIAAAFLLTGMISAQKIDINAMPKAGPTPAINISKPKTFQLSNGLTVMVVENSKLPRVNTTLTIDRAPYYEGNIVGVSNLMAELFDNGTTNLSKDEFNKKVDFLGAKLNFSPNGASSNSLSKYFPDVLSLLADAIVNPNFSTQEMQNAKERIIEGLKVDEKNASSIAEKVSNALMYGKNTARGEFETQESINKIQLSDVQTIYKKYYTPDNAYLVIVGDVTFEKIKPLVEKAFNGWKKANTPISQLEPASNVATTEINIVDVPSAVQSVISVNNLNTLKMKDPDYFSATLANYILGGGGEARLFMNLREKNGFTYGAYSNMIASKYSPSFSAEASVRNEVTDKAVVEFMNELKAISTVKPEELENAKAKLKGSFIMSLEKPETIAKFALNQKTQDLPSDFYTNYLKSIDKVRPADITKAVKANILPDQSRIFIAGKSSDISEGLEKLGYPVKYYDKEANPSAKPTVQKVDANVTLSSVAEKYINIIGGADAVQRINSITTEASTKVQGMDMTMKMIQAKGAKMAMTISMMGNTIQKIVFDGKEGYMEVQGQKKVLDDKQKAEMSKEKELFPELGFAKNTSLKLAGIEKYNHEDSYVVKGDKVTYYYSLATGLKTGEVKIGEGGAIPTSYADYKDISGVKLPFTIIQNMSGMEINLAVKSAILNEAKDSDFR